MQNRTLPLDHIITIPDNRPSKIHGFFTRKHNNWSKAKVGLASLGSALYILCLLTPKPENEKDKLAIWLSVLFLLTAGCMHLCSDDSYNKETCEIDIKISRI